MKFGAALVAALASVAVGQLQAGKACDACATSEVYKITFGDKKVDTACVATAQCTEASAPIGTVRCFGNGQGTGRACANVPSDYATTGSYTYAKADVCFTYDCKTCTGVDTCKYYTNDKKVEGCVNAAFFSSADMKAGAMTEVTKCPTTGSVGPMATTLLAFGAATAAALVL